MGKKRAYVYEIDPKTDFVKRINRHQDKIISQASYFNHYQQLQRKAPKEKSVIVKPEYMQSLQIIGSCHIHPTANVDITAIIGPNVSIGAKAKIKAGVRIKNSIIMEDVEIQAHTVVTNSLIGWNSKIGPWCRIEGSLPLTSQNRPTYQQKKANTIGQAS